MNQNVRVRLKFQALLHKGIDPIVRTIHLANFGIGAAECATEVEPALDGVLLQMKLQRPATLDETRHAYRAWLCGVAIRQYIEVHSTFLEEAGVVAALIHRARDAGYRLNLNELRRKLNRINFPSKLAYIEDKIESSVSADLRSRIETINRARNCYEHREGVVREQDLCGEDSLRVDWKAIEIWVRTSEGEITVESVPFVVPPKGEVLFKQVDRTKQFRLRERLEFSANDISEIGLTFTLHAQEVVRALEKAASEASEG